MNEVLQLLRIAKGYTVSEMAALLGKSQPYISRIESGEKKPSEELLNQYSKIFKIKVSSIKFFEQKKTQEHLVYEEILLMILKSLCRRREKNNLK